MWPGLGQTHFLIAGFFLAIGITNLVFWRTNGRKFFARTQTCPPFVAGVCARGGEKGVQVLFLGVGVIFGVAGCIVMMLGPGMTWLMLGFVAISRFILNPPVPLTRIFLRATHAAFRQDRARN